MKCTFLISCTLCPIQSVINMYTVSITFNTMYKNWCKRMTEWWAVLPCMTVNISCLTLWHVMVSGQWWSVATDPSSDLSSRHIRQLGRRVITRQLMVFSRDVANTDWRRGGHCWWRAFGVEKIATRLTRRFVSARKKLQQWCSSFNQFYASVDH